MRSRGESGRDERSVGFRQQRGYSRREKKRANGHFDISDRFAHDCRNYRDRSLREISTFESLTKAGFVLVTITRMTSENFAMESCTRSMRGIVLLATRDRDITLFSIMLIIIVSSRLMHAGIQQLLD